MDARRRARSHVSELSGRVPSRYADLSDVFGYLADGLDVVGDPVVEGASGRIRVVYDENQGSGVFGDAFDAERGRRLVAVARVDGRNGLRHGGHGLPLHGP